MPDEKILRNRIKNIERRLDDFKQWERMEVYSCLDSELNVYILDNAVEDIDIQLVKDITTCLYKLDVKIEREKILQNKLQRIFSVLEYHFGHSTKTRVRLYAKLRKDPK